ncbi:MAG: UvrD-helicase domain-containing protein [Saprospiraceae bacterium]|nr:UvrD-helicase domain-containing protein [Saprospiraceae bacterium]MDW8229857.1 UvrD-helicase domain-containing protein [Saprospiraceae bacterium]
MPITLISAGAGSGKTYTLTERMVALIGQGVRPSGIVATTFTQKAAAELYERVHARLLRSGMTDAAQALSGALIGTVHSIGARLLQRFAFEAGASPVVEIIADSDHKRLFNEALAQVLDETRSTAMNRLADRLGFNKKSTDEKFDWRTHIREITDAARANMLSAETLQHSKQRSLDTFFALLPPVSAQTADEWSQQLARLLEQAIEAIENNLDDDTKTTRDTLEELRAYRTLLKQRGFLYWYEWAKLSKMNVAAKSRELFEPLKTFAQSHGEHPGFQSDIRQYLSQAFDIAADALAEYQRYKRKRGLIDYTDMETQVAQLLRIPSVRQVLASEIDLLLVDEFQDTSPIQLDIFLQLSQIARQAIWVGDPKQSIYGFRGAEPALMQAVVEATGGIQPENILRHSWRSRPDIVHFANAIFTQAFSNLPSEQVALEPALPAEKYAHPDAPSGVIHWHFLSQDDHRKTPGKPWLEHCIARQIRHLIENPIPVWDKKRHQTRPLRSGDIAVLCRTNHDCKTMAQALHHAGLKAAVEREGLLETAEGRLVIACLKYLLNPADALSAAEILVLSGSQTIDEVVEQRLAHLDEQNPQRWEAHEHDLLRSLERLRAQAADLSAAEVLQLLFAELGLQHRVAAWHQAERRLDNLDRLRRCAAEYESACQRIHSGASLGGFLLWLDEQSNVGADFQGSGEGSDTVRVMTYHRSKGLEFPLTVCCQLDAKPKDRLWGAVMQSDRLVPDLDDVLGGRWIRFWVNPYADQWQKTRLAEALQQSPAWQQDTQQTRDEETRLLYVALTRARDYLVLPTTAKGGAAWVSRVLFQDESVPFFDPQTDELPLTWQRQPLRCHRSVFYEPAQAPEALPPLQNTLRYFEYPPGRSPEPPPALWIDPQVEYPPGLSPRWSEPETFAQPLSFSGEYTPALSRATEAFFAASDPALTEEQRAQLAAAILQNWGLTDRIVSTAFLQHAQTFGLWAARRGRAQSRAAFPLEGNVGQRRIRITVDLFWENDREAVALFWAGFAEGMKKWKEQAKPMAPSMAWAVHLLAKSRPGKTVSCWAVFAVEGQAVRMRI